MGKLEKIERCIQKGKEDELVKLVHDHDKAIRLAAIDGLGKAGKDNACNVLITLLLDEDAEIRAASAAALGVLGDPRAHTLLLHHLSVEKDAQVAAAIKAAVGKLHGGE